jgi:hypothetical protein
MHAILQDIKFRGVLSSFGPKLLQCLGISWCTKQPPSGIHYRIFFHLPPLSFNCVSGCWIEPRIVFTFVLAVRRSHYSARSHQLLLL